MTVVNDTIINGLPSVHELTGRVFAITCVMVDEHQVALLHTVLATPSHVVTITELVAV